MVKSKRAFLAQIRLHTHRQKSLTDIQLIAIYSFAPFKICMYTNREFPPVMKIRQMYREKLMVE